jgi:putative transposase
MARLPRYNIINQPQHIILRSREGQTIFFEEQDYQYFHDCLDAAAYNYDLKLHAYVLMPNHVHVLATPGNSNSVSRVVQSIGRNYVQYFNECYGGSGSLWEGRYRATVIDGKNYLLSVSRYIELNPVRNGLVDKPKEYRWSSYAHNALGQTDEMISAAREYQQLGDSDKARSNEYRKLFQQKLDPQLVEEITESALKGWVLGDSRFARKIEKLSGRRATPLPRGRPRKS